MGLSERKITTWTKPISSLADRPQMSAAELKAAFDSNANEIKPKFNGLVDDLIGAGGASEIGASLDGVVGTNVQALLAALKALIDLRETTASTDEKLSEKANQTTVNKTFKDISVNESTGVVTLTYVDGTTKAVNTSLSKIAVNFGFDAETQKITLMLNDGTTQHIDVSAFIKPNEIVDSDNIVVARNADGTVSLSVKSGSINAEMLTSTILDELKAYRDAAAISAQNAAASESNAQTYKNAAANFSQSAQDALNETIQHKNTAYLHSQAALESKNAAEASATEAGQQAGSASGFAVRAEEALSKMGVHIGADTPANGAKLWLCPVNNPLVMNPDRATSDMTQEVGVNDKGKLVTKPTTSVEGGGTGTGVPGPAGADGKSAYQYAVEGGYTGTEAEFSAKLAKEKFANPNALTFTGAVTGSYDGSAPLEVAIPSGGGGSGGAVSWKLIRTINIVSGTSTYSFNTDNNGNAFKVKNFLILIDAYPINGYLETKPNSNFSFVQKPQGKQSSPFSFMMKRATDGRYILENSNTSNSIFERKISDEYSSFGEFTSFSFWFSVDPSLDTTMYILGEDV